MPDSTYTLTAFYDNLNADPLGSLLDPIYTRQEAEKKAIRILQIIPHLGINKRTSWGGRVRIYRNGKFYSEIWTLQNPKPLPEECLRYLSSIPETESQSLIALGKERLARLL
jgi:hypothetical protein